MNKQTIYIFGNPLLSFDNLPIKLKPKLEKAFPQINFIIQDPNENIKPSYVKTSEGRPPYVKTSEGRPPSVRTSEGRPNTIKELVIIDTVVGIDKVMIIDNINDIELNNVYSMHDFDLGFNLKLLKKIGQLDKITIFGVPQKYDKNKALDELIILINNTK